MPIDLRTLSRQTIQSWSFRGPKKANDDISGKPEQPERFTWQVRLK